MALRSCCCFIRPRHVSYLAVRVTGTEREMAASHGPGRIGCFGLTEPNVGSDVSSLETVARKHGNKWIINGAKQWISEAAIADVAIVWAKTDRA